MCDVCGNLPEWLTVPLETLSVKKKRRPKAAIPEPALRSAPRPDSPRPQPNAAAKPSPTPLPAGDRELLEFFKEWRRRTAQRAAVPAYVVLTDAALDDLCRKRPTNLRELLQVTGIGERKAEQYGSEIFAVFEAYRKGARAEVREKPTESPAAETLRLLAEGRTFDEIAQARGRQVSTVINMVADLVEKGRLAYRLEWIGEDVHKQIEEVIQRLGSQWLKPLREALPQEVTYDQIRLVVAYCRAAEAASQE